MCLCHAVLTPLWRCPSGTWLWTIQGTSLEFSAILSSANHSMTWHTEQESLDGWGTDPQAELVGFEHINAISSKGNL